MTSQAKIIAPSSHRIVPRPRLIKQLTRKGCPSITWIVGPPGSGKTSLAVSLIDHGAEHLWYQVDARDGDPATLFAYLHLAIQKVPNHQHFVLPVFGPEYGQGVLTFARRFFEALFARLPAGAILVLDNYHEIPTEALTHEVLREGLSVLPHGIRVLVLSRQPPPQGYARLQANGQMQLMEWDDLRMTRAESMALIQVRASHDAVRDHGSEFYRLTDGWPAGLVLLTSNHRDGRDASPLVDMTNRDLLFDYFASEVFDCMDPEWQRVLLRTAILPCCTAAQADAISEVPGAGPLLHGLARSGYFTVEHDCPDPMYEYHPLFRSFLVERGKKIFTQETLNDLRNRAALVLEEDGDIESAIALFQMSQAWELLKGIVLRNAPSLVSQGRNNTLNEWIHSLPRDVVEGNGWLLYWLGICQFPVDLKQSRLILEKAFTCFETQGETSGQLLAWSGIVDSILYAWDDFAQLDRWIAWLDAHHEISCASQDVYIDAAVIASMFGALVQRQPGHRDIALWLELALRLLREGPVTHSRIRAGTFAADYSFWTGDYAMIRNIAVELRKIAHFPDAPPLCILSWNWTETCCIMCFQEASPKKVLESVDSSLAYAQKTGVHMLDFLIYAQGAAGSLIDGNLAGASSFLDRMALTAQGRNGGAYHHYLASWHACLSKDMPAALMHVEQALSLAVESGMPFSIVLVRHALAEVLFELGRGEEARHELAKAQHMAEGLKSDYLSFVCGLTEARFALARKRPSNSRAEALVPLKRAMALGRKRGFQNFCWWIPEWMTQLYFRALEAGIEVDYVRRVIRTRNLMPSEPPFQCDNWPWGIRITTLGRFTILRDDQELIFTAKAPRRVLLLLKALVAAGSSGIGENKLIDWLWPESEGDMAKKTLEICLHRLRQLLGVEGVIVLREGHLKLDPFHCWVDAHAFEALLEPLLMHPSATIQGMDGKALEQALILYNGPFLENFEEAWAQSYRERLRDRFLKALLAQGKRCERASDSSGAIAWYERGLKADPLAEPLYRRIMICHQTTGRLAEGLRVHERCRIALRTSLGVDPAPETEAVARAFRR